MIETTHFSVDAMNDLLFIPKRSANPNCDLCTTRLSNDLMKFFKKKPDIARHMHASQAILEVAHVKTILHPKKSNGDHILFFRFAGPLDQSIGITLNSSDPHRTRKLKRAAADYIKKIKKPRYW